MLNEEPPKRLYPWTQTNNRLNPQNEIHTLRQQLSLAKCKYKYLIFDELWSAKLDLSDRVEDIHFLILCDLVYHIIGRDKYSRTSHSVTEMQPYQLQYFGFEP